MEYYSSQKEYRQPHEKYKKQDEDFSSHIPFRQASRMNSYQLGNGVLGRYFPGTGEIQIADFAHGDDFSEIYTHEARHSMNHSSEEKDVREFTRNVLKKTKWH